MSEGYKIQNQAAIHFLTFQVVQWADIFTRQIYRDIVVESFEYCQKNKGLELIAYVIMSNHVHLVAGSKNNKLSDLIRDMKRHTSKNIIEAIENGNESRREWLLMILRYAAKGHSRNNEYQLWTHENHPEELYSYHFIEQKINYIHNNPVKARIVFHPEDYIYSSARNYAGLDNILEIDTIDLYI